jgi:hypothetical protein
LLVVRSVHGSPVVRQYARKESVRLSRVGTQGVVAGKIARWACDRIAQGCRLGGYPGKKEGKRNHTPKGFHRAVSPTPTQPFQG